MLSHTVARRYAKGLLEAVAEVAPGSEREVGDQLTELAATVEGHPALKLLVINPAIPVQQKTVILGKISELMGSHATTRRFIDVLAEKHRLDHLSLITKVYGDLVDDQQGVVKADIATSVSLNPGQVAELETKLRAATGGDVRLTRRTDPALLGGVVVRIGDTVYDGSVKGYLERIRERLGSTQ
jgi:F-type H+-transporting ATPase subunit delta